MNSYRLKATGHSSASRYGVCECCRKPAPEVYIQTRLESYSFLDGGAQNEGWAQRETIFGHKDCLIGSRRGEVYSGSPLGGTASTPGVGVTAGETA
jgi:hypothetical protein